MDVFLIPSCFDIIWHFQLLFFFISSQLFSSAPKREFLYVRDVHFCLGMGQILLGETEATIQGVLFEYDEPASCKSLAQA